MLPQLLHNLQSLVSVSDRVLHSMLRLSERAIVAAPAGDDRAAVVMTMRMAARLAAHCPKTPVGYALTVTGNLADAFLIACRWLQAYLPESDQAAMARVIANLEARTAAGDAELWTALTTGKRYARD